MLCLFRRQEQDPLHSLLGFYPTLDLFQYLSLGSKNLNIYHFLDYLPIPLPHLRLQCLVEALNQHSMKLLNQLLEGKLLLFHHGLLGYHEGPHSSNYILRFPALEWQEHYFPFEQFFPQW